MLQELAAETEAQTWVILSLLLFAGFFSLVALRVLTQKRGAYDAVARLPLEDSVTDAPLSPRTPQRAR